MTVGQLRKLLRGFSDDAPITVQVVGQQSGAWNMFLSVRSVPHYRGGKEPVFTVDHPNLLRLPMGDAGWRPER